MKLFSAVLFGFALNSAAHAGSLKYNCECIDTGLECDGAEKIALTLSETKSKTIITDPDGDFPMILEGSFDASYEPKKNKEMIRFKSTKVKGANGVSAVNYPYILVNRNMLKGVKTGIVKTPTFGDQGDYGWEYYYECKLN